ncbi:hypothetical protein [Streptomyces sp. RG80]|uniref:hypothetical protein n=1 Tax=Streptomyces sp. RG80 TaxID=3157340 RepID=UPI00338DD6A7
MAQHTPKPIEGWFIPNPPPSKPKLPLLARIAVGAGVGLAVVLGSQAHTGDQPAAPSPNPSATTAGR